MRNIEMGYIVTGVLGIGAILLYSAGLLFDPKEEFEFEEEATTYYSCSERPTKGTDTCPVPSDCWRDRQFTKGYECVAEYR